MADRVLRAVASGREPIRTDPPSHDLAPRQIARCRKQRRGVRSPRFADDFRDPRHLVVPQRHGRHPDRGRIHPSRRRLKPPRTHWDMLLGRGPSKNSKSCQRSASNSFGHVGAG